MADNYYRPCKELNDCLEIDKYWNNKEYDKWSWKKKVINKE